MKKITNIKEYNGNISTNINSFDENYDISDQSDEESKCLLDRNKSPALTTSTPAKNIKIKYPRYTMMNSSFELLHHKYILTHQNRGTSKKRYYMVAIGHLYDNPTSCLEISYHEFIILIIYIIEFSLRLWCCVIKSKYAYHGRMLYLKKFQNIIDLITMLSTIALMVFMVVFDEKLLTNKYIHICFFSLKALQILRLFRLDRHFGSAKLFIFVLHTYRHELFTATMSSLFLFLISSFFVYFVEYEGRHYFKPIKSYPTTQSTYQSSQLTSNNNSILSMDSSNSSIRSIPEAFYFSVVSFLTIGYGDYVPHTIAGKVFITLMSFIAVAIVSLPSNIIGSAFALHVTLKAKERHVRDLHYHAALLIQRVWRFNSIVSKYRDVAIDGLLQSLENQREQSNSQNVTIGICGRKKQDKYSFIRRIRSSSKRIKLSTISEPLSGTVDCSDVKLERAMKYLLIFIFKCKVFVALSIFKKSKKQYLLTDFVSIFENYKNEVNQRMQHLETTIDKQTENIKSTRESIDQKIDTLTQKIDALSLCLNQQNQLLARLIDPPEQTTQYYHQ